MTDRMIVLASPNNTTVFRGEYALIELTLATAGDVLTLAELPERTALEISNRDGSEVRWAGPRTLIYRAPTKSSGDRFKVRRDDGLHQHYIRVDHTKSQSTPAEQARLKMIFDVAPPTMLVDGKGIGAVFAPAPDDDLAEVDAKWPGLIATLKNAAS
jgi:hypothetical protein